MNSFFRLAASWLLLAGCNEAASGPPAKPVADGISALPHVRGTGHDIPYFRYRPAPPGSGVSQAIFLYPVLDDRSALLALDVSAQTRRIADLFGEELLGTSGRVVIEEGVVHVDFLPVSVRVGVQPGQEWRMKYAQKDFVCRSEAVADPRVTGRLKISCSSPEYTLSFVFDRDKGVETYQDFCGQAICTYELQDAEGLLSKDVLEYMGLPRV